MTYYDDEWITVRYGGNRGRPRQRTALNQRPQTKRWQTSSHQIQGRGDRVYRGMDRALLAPRFGGGLVPFRSPNPNHAI